MNLLPLLWKNEFQEVNKENNNKNKKNEKKRFNYNDDDSMMFEIFNNKILL